MTIIGIYKGAQYANTTQEWRKNLQIQTQQFNSVKIRDGTRKLSEISDLKFSGNFQKEISITFRNHSIFLLLH